MSAGFRRGALLMGLLASILGLLGCGDRPTSQVVFRTGADSWQALQASSRDGAVHVGAMGGAYGETQEALAARAAAILRDNFSDPWLKFETDATRTANPFRLVFVFEARVVRQPDFYGVCAGKSLRFEADPKNTNIHAVLCGPNGPVTGVHGWMRRIDRADDPSFAKLIVQIALQAMRGAT
jgi:hypothetical protein